MGKNTVINSPFAEPCRHPGYGRWAFIEVTDPWDAKKLIRAAIATQSGIRK